MTEKQQKVEVQEEIQAEEGVHVCGHGWRQGLCPGCPEGRDVPPGSLRTPEDDLGLRTR